MSPPDLAADAPILNVLQPLRVNLFPVRGKEPDQMIAHHGERFLRFRITQKPLLAQPRLDRHVAALAEADIVLMRLRFRQQPLLLQQFGRLFARFESIEPVQFRHRRTIDPAIRVQHIDHRQIVALADFKIELVVRRRHFQHAGAEFGSIASSRNDRNFFARSSGRHACFPTRSA